MLHLGGVYQLLPDLSKFTNTPTIGVIPFHSVKFDSRVMEIKS